jgi:hypothetical protein
MSDPVLEKDKSNSIGGVVLTSQGGAWKRPTGVFLPDPRIAGDRALTILFWFHGHFVKDIPSLFYKDGTKILQAVLNSGKRLILVAPHLGWFKTAKESDYNASALGGGNLCEQYLDQVLAALADWRAATLDVDPQAVPKYQVAEIYIAGHSGGGGGITTSIASLGGYKDLVRECWGFDCLYGSGQSWYQWARGQGRMPLYFYFGQGTQPGYHADVLGFWKLVYGTPRSPLPLGARLLNVHLAPALPGTETDMVAFQFSEDIKAKPTTGNPYEAVRKQVDPLLDNPARYWSTIIGLGLKDHYPVASEMLGPRIRQSIP